MSHAHLASRCVDNQEQTMNATAITPVHQITSMLGATLRVGVTGGEAVQLVAEDQGAIDSPRVGMWVSTTDIRDLRDALSRLLVDSEPPELQRARDTAILAVADLMSAEEVMDQVDGGPEEPGEPLAPRIERRWVAGA